MRLEIRQVGEKGFEKAREEIAKGYKDHYSGWTPKFDRRFDERTY